MSPKLLKWSRVVIALAVCCVLTAAFVDFRGLIPWKLGNWLAEIQFVPSLVALVTGAGISLACTIILVVTLAAGRIYCSTICPLGILQDVVIRIRRWLPGKARLARFTKPHTAIRHGFLWATIIFSVVGFGGFALSLLDPYSNFGRIAADIFRPLVTAGNNALVTISEKFGWQTLYRVEPMWAEIGALMLPLVMLLAVVALATWRGRLYCNTVCPVGTLLGLFSQRAAFRLKIEQSACQKCGDCLRVCKAQCIELRSGTIDFSRCVACYDCLDVCQHHGIGYQFAWTKTPEQKLVKPKEAKPETVIAANPQRRVFIAQTIVGTAVAGSFGALLLADDEEHEGHHSSSNEEKDSRAICPPGSSGVERFLDRCTACHLCVSACPTGVLRPAFLEYGILGLMKPHMNYHASFCNFDCRRCAEVCPDGAISLLALADKQLAKIGEAHFNKDKCVVVTNGTDCAACSEHCPTKAVFTKPYGDNLRLPEVNADLCIGCGACEFACPVRPDRAIQVHGLKTHEVAKKFVEPKATLPKSFGDFPF